MNLGLLRSSYKGGGGGGTCAQGGSGKEGAVSYRQIRFYPVSECDCSSTTDSHIPLTKCRYSTGWHCIAWTTW